MLEEINLQIAWSWFRWRHVSRISLSCLTEDLPSHNMPMMRADRTMVRTLCHFFMISALLFCKQLPLELSIFFSIGQQTGWISIKSNQIWWNMMHVISYCTFTVFNIGKLMQSWLNQYYFTFKTSQSLSRSPWKIHQRIFSSQAAAAAHRGLPLTRSGSYWWQLQSQRGQAGGCVTSYLEECEQLFQKP